MYAVYKIAYYCLNQDVQDLRMYRMFLDDCLLCGECCGCQNQDVQDLRMYRMWLFDYWWVVDD